jgi:hypothetical protein
MREKIEFRLAEAMNTALDIEKHCPLVLRPAEWQDRIHAGRKAITVQLIKDLREEIEKGLLTDINGKDSKQAEADLASHKLSTLFSYRQAYFVGCNSQLQKILKILGEK